MIPSLLNGVKVQDRYGLENNLESTSSPTQESNYSIPLKLTSEARQEIIEGLELGNDIGVVARSVGISPSTLNHWLSQGENPKNVFLHEFFLQCGKAVARAEMGWVSIISRAAEKDWRAAESLLGKRFHKRWAKKDRVEHSGTVKQDNTITLELIKSIREDPNERRRLLKEWESRSLAEPGRTSSGDQQGSVESSDSPSLD